MKCFLKKSVVVLSMFLLLTICFAMTIHAAGKIPTKCRGYSNSAWNRVTIPLEKEQYIKITSSKGLKSKVTYENYGSSFEDSSAEISYYSAKTGKFTIKFDVYSSNTKKKVSSHTLTAYIYDDIPVKSVLIDGKSFGSIVTKDAVTVKVTMNKGYTLKKVECGTYGKPTKGDYGHESSTITYKRFKNGSKITLGKYPDYSASNSDSGEYRYHYMNTSLLPQTQILITYVDKYTGLETTTSYSLYKAN